MECRVELPSPRQSAAPDGRQKLSGRLGIAFIPATLLLPPTPQAVRQLARHRYGDEIQRTPSFHLGAVAEVEILCQRITMPSTGSLDRCSPPNAAGAVERQDLTRPTSGRLLHCEMALENNLLRTGHAVFSGIQKVAAGLNKGETRIREQRPKTQSQEIGGWDIIGVEHRDKRLAGASQSGHQSPGFEARAVGALDQSDIVAAPAELVNGCPGYLSARIGAVVEQLYLQPIARPIQRYRRVKSAAHKVTFVEGGNLNENGGEFTLCRKRVGESK